METEIIVNNVITKEQKIKFFEFALNLFRNKIEIKLSSDLNLHENLRDYGFCLIFKHFFGQSNFEFDLLPELRKHRPRKKFYDYDGNKSENKYDFWFPLSGEQTQRIKICEKILAELKS